VSLTTHNIGAAVGTEMDFCHSITLTVEHTGMERSNSPEPRVPSKLVESSTRLGMVISRTVVVSLFLAFLAVSILNAITIFLHHHKPYW